MCVVARVLFYVTLLNTGYANMATEILMECVGMCVLRGEVVYGCFLYSWMCC